MPAQEAFPGKLGPYRLVELIGQGGMGVVYLGRDPEGRPVAVKVLGPAVIGDPTARRRLVREVETMRRVRSPYVAEIVDADVTGPSPYIVTRFVPGRTLDDVVRQDGPLRGPALERLAAGLAHALAAIHSAGVVHRDLKPGNVMMVDGRPVVIDFGIAHIGDATRLTQTGMVMGTPGYLAPEVIEGQPSSGASDVHSWGATVAFAATGRSPYGGGSFQTIFFRVIQGRADLDGVPAALLPLLSAALSPDPRARPPAALLADRCAGLDLAVPAAAYAAPTVAAAAPVAAPPPFPAPAPPSYFPPGRNGAGLAPAGYADQARPRLSPGEAAAGVADLLPPVDYAPAPQAPPAGPQPGMSSRPPAARKDAAEGAAGARPAGAGGSPSRRPASYWLLSLAVMVGAVALSIILPVAGTLVSLAVITLLRAADRAQSALAVRRSVRGARPSDVLIVVVTAPLTVARALLTTALLAPLALAVAAVAAAAAIVVTRMNAMPEPISWAAGALVAWYGIGPGSRRPRRQLSRMFATVVRKPGSMAVAAIVLWALAGAAVSSALSQPPLFWPLLNGMLPHLPSLSSTLHTVQHWLLGHTTGMLHLP
ncbi:MAG: serine/threonine protein kinase [Streptosporangiaceae bacterium]|nr:serine/threonine protein kinase [Streptosporangiaceae bacterium]MBV9855545.1 serine/threonine protein kinase [Streptosporangiaceae bacterium]